MLRPVDVKPVKGYRLWLRYSDGAEGEVDLSRLVGRGVFRIWEEPGVFETVSLGPHGEIRWGEDVDLCPQALYLEMTGKAAEDIFPALDRHRSHA